MLTLRISHINVKMNIKLIILATISSVCAIHFDLNSLPPANVANVFHESGITFVSPSTTNLVPSTSNLVPSTELLPPPIPITHAFGFVSPSANHPHQELVRTHSFQPISHGLHSSVSAVHPHITDDDHVNDEFLTHNIHASVPVSVPNDESLVRFAEHNNNFEYNVPLTTTTPVAHTTQFEPPQIHSTYDVPVKVPSSIHSTYGVPETVNAAVPVLSEEEHNSLPIFENDKFLSPVVRHTNTPTNGHLSKSSFAIHSNPTHNIENFIYGNNHYSNSFSLSDGTKVSEQGKLISTANGSGHVIAKMGEYEYITPEGKQVKVKWVADDKGFRVIT